MIIEHITSIECSYVIINSGKFKSNSMGGDTGLNCLNGGGNNIFDSEGVKMSFNWSGPIQNDHNSTKMKYFKNILIDNGEWRLFVPAGTDKHLTFDSITIMDYEAFVQFLISATPWYLKIPCTNWLNRRENKYVSFFRKSKGKSIVVL